jgi:hypothetical protein
MVPEIRKAIIKGQMVTDDSDKIDDQIKSEIVSSNIQKSDLIYPHFKIEFKTYDPFPTKNCVEELHESIKESIISGEQLFYIIDQYNSSDVLDSEPINKTETEIIKLGFGYIQKEGNSSMVRVNLREFENIL